MLAESELGRRLFHFKFSPSKFASTMEYQRFSLESIAPTNFVFLAAATFGGQKVRHNFSCKNSLVFNNLLIRFRDA